MRTKNSFKNIFYGVGGQFLENILNFINRTVFIYTLGTIYLGLNGLFSNILSMLSLAELGIGSAIIFNLYKPLAEGDNKKVKALMNFYAKTYKLIGLFVAIVGILLIPFLNNIIGNQPNVHNLTTIYLLYLANSVSSYFFAFKRSLLMADQKNYINTINKYSFEVIRHILQLIILLMTKDFILYLAIQIVITISSNITISNKVNKIYPYLNTGIKEKLTKPDKKNISKHIRAMMSHKIGGVVVNGTDNILITTYIGIYWTGLYSNYFMILSIINAFLGQLFTSITASIGNLNVQESTEKSQDLFYKILFINAWLIGFASIAFWHLLNPFITIWIGEKYIFDELIVLIIVINFFIQGMRKTVITYNTTLGLFWNDRHKPWFEAIINLVASILLIKMYGLIGVFLGTLISLLTTSFWVEPYILYKHGFKNKLIKYYFKYFSYTSVIIITGFITGIINNFINSTSFSGFILSFLVCMLIPNTIFLMIYYKSAEFKYFYNLIINIRK